MLARHILGSLHPTEEKQARRQARKLSFQYLWQFPKEWSLWLIYPTSDGRDRLLDWQVHRYHRRWGAFTSKWLWSKTNKQQLLLVHNLRATDTRGCAADMWIVPASSSVCRGATLSNSDVRSLCIEIATFQRSISICKKRVKHKIHCNTLPYEFCESVLTRHKVMGNTHLL